MAIEYLADTNVLSETTKPAPNAGVLAWLALQAPIRLAAVSLYELARGIEHVPQGRKRRFLDGWLALLLAGNAAVLPFDDEAALAAARIEKEARRRGRPIGDRDLFILATAKVHGLRVATHNVNHFVGHGVAVYDPFENLHLI